MARLRGKTVFLGDVAQNRDNNLNLLRFLAAATVALSHSFLLVTGDPESRPLMKATGFSIGYHAVDIFFVISGFLVTQSWMRRSSLLDFTVARALRRCRNQAMAYRRITPLPFSPIFQRLRTSIAPNSLPLSGPSTGLWQW